MSEEIITQPDKAKFVTSRGWRRLGGGYWRKEGTSNSYLLNTAYDLERANGQNEPSEPIPPAGYPYAEPNKATYRPVANEAHTFLLDAARWLGAREAKEESDKQFGKACQALNKYRQQFNWQDTPVVVHWRGSLYVIRFTMENGAPAIEARLATTPEGIEGGEPPY